MRAAFKNGLAFAQNHETGPDILRRHSIRGLHVLCRRVKDVRGKRESVLQAMRHHQRAGLENVALLHDQLNDRG